MASNEDILKEADYYLEKDVTIEQASIDLGIGKRTLQLHLKKLESIAPDKFILVTDKKKNNEKQGKIKGGTLGKRKPNWTVDEAKEVAKKILESEHTFQSASDELGIPRSSLHEMVTKSKLDDDTTSLLYALTLVHSGKMTPEQFRDQFNRAQLKNSNESNNIKK